MEVARSYKRFGLQLMPNGDITYTEWAPSAKQVSLFGDFNNWDRNANLATRNEFGVWTLTLNAGENGEPALKHESKYKCCITT